MAGSPQDPGSLRQNRGLLISAGVLLVAFALFWWFDLRQPGRSTSPSPSPLPSPIVGTKIADVQKVVIKSGGKALTLTRTAAGWSYGVCADTVTDCPSQPADLTGATGIVGAILGLRPTTTIAVPDALSNYGLDKSGPEIDIQATTGTTVLLVGLKAPDQSSYYLRVKDKGPIYVVPGSLQTDILGRIDSPPAPLPTPSPASSTAPAPSPSPSAP